MKYCFYISFSLSGLVSVACCVCVCVFCVLGGCLTSYLHTSTYTIPGHILKSLDIGASLKTVLLSHSPGTTCQWLHKMEGQAGSQGLWKEINKPVIIDVKLSMQVSSSRQIKAKLWMYLDKKNTTVTTESSCLYNNKMYLFIHVNKVHGLFSSTLTILILSFVQCYICYISSTLFMYVLASYSYFCMFYCFL